MSELVVKIEPSSSSSRADLVGVHEVAVVRDGERALVRVVDDGLRVLEERLARRRVPHVADRRGAGQAGEPCLVEDVGDVAHLLLDGHALAGPRDDARGLLPPVLHRIEAEVRQVRGVRVAEDAEDPALVPELVLRFFREAPATTGVYPGSRASRRLFTA